MSQFFGILKTGVICETRADIACWYAEQGFGIIPLEPRLKRPYTGRSWLALETRDEEAVRGYWSDNPDRNIGVVARGWIIIDVDSKNDHTTIARLGNKTTIEHYGKSAMELFHDLGLPETFTVRTPTGGMHFYFRGPNVQARSLYPGAIDTRSGSGYVVGVGSSIDVGEYVVEHDSPFADAPDHLIAQYREFQQSKNNTVDFKERTQNPHRIADAIEYLKYEAIPSIQGSGGDQALYVNVARLHDKGVQPLDAYELIIQHLNERCVPPWDRSDIATKVKNGYKYAKSDFGWDAVDVIAPVPDMDFSEPPKDFKPSPNLICLSNFFKQKPEPREWFIKGWIPHKEVTLFYGDGGLGKSRLALQLAAACITKTQWLGMDIEQEGVAYVLSTEDRISELHNRCYEIAQDVPELQETPYGKIWGKCTDTQQSKEGHVVTSAFVVADKTNKLICTPLYTTEILKEIQALRPKLIVLDNLATIFPGNQNEPTQAHAFISMLRTLAVSADATILLLGHPSSSGMESGRGTSGSVAWNAATRCRLYLKEEESEDNEKKTNRPLVLSVEKTNYGGNRHATVRMQWEGGGYHKIEDRESVDNRMRQQLAEKVYAIMGTDGSLSISISVLIDKLCVEDDLIQYITTEKGSHAAREHVKNMFRSGATVNGETLSVYQNTITISP